MQTQMAHTNIEIVCNYRHSAMYSHFQKSEWVRKIEKFTLWKCAKWKKFEIVDFEMWNTHSFDCTHTHTHNTIQRNVPSVNWNFMTKIKRNSRIDGLSFTITNNNLTLLKCQNIFVDLCQFYYSTTLVRIHYKSVFVAEVAKKNVSLWQKIIKIVKIIRSISTMDQVGIVNHFDL